MAALSKVRGYALTNAHLPCEILHPSRSCTYNAVTFFFDSIKGSAKFFLVAYLIPMLINRRMKSEMLLQEIINYVHSLMFGAGCASLTMCFLCIFRRLLGRFYEYNLGLIPGFIAGSSIFIEVPFRRGIAVTVLLAFVVDLYLKVLQQKGIITLPLPRQLLMFSVCSSGLLYCLRSIKESYSLMWPLVPQRVPSDPVAQKHCRHKGRCLDSIRKIAVSYLLYGLIIQGLKITAFNFRLLLTKPRLFLQAFLNRNNARLPLFLVLYFSLFKGVSCLLVNLRKQDEAWHSLVAGGIASLSYLVQPNLTLTCLAFSNLSQIICRKYKQKLKLPPWPWREIFYMMLMGMLFHARAAYPSAFPPSMTATMETITSGRAKFVYDLVEENLVTRW